MIDLKPNEIYFFYCMVDTLADPLLLERYRSEISASERAKTDRYVFEKDRHRCLVTRALARYVLSACTNVQPGALEFTQNQYGKPDLKPGCVTEPIRFNISHSGGMTACAVALGCAVGVDVERRRDDIDLSLADRYFTASEASYIHSRTAGSRPAAFFDIWTLKEAYIKARGMGLSIDLNCFGFEIGHDIQIYMENDLDDRPDRWSFFQFTPEPDYHAAIAVQDGAKAGLKINVHRCIPFVTIEF